MPDHDTTDSWWWYRDSAKEAWRVVHVKRYVEMSGPSFAWQGGWKLCSSARGQWGPRIEPPE